MPLRLNFGIAVRVMIALLCCCAPVLARVGETEAQINTRYGSSVGDIPTQAFGPVRGFALPNYLVGVKLANGSSVMEMISRNDQAEMKPEEIDALLKKHGADVAWRTDKFDEPGWKRWRTEDYKLVAVYDSTRHFLYVNTKDFYEEQGRKSK